MTPRPLNPNSEPGDAPRVRSASFLRLQRGLAAATVWLFLLASACVQAQSVPPLVNYQGRLSNPDGSPLPTADYTLTFNLYDAATNGALVWGPQVFDGTAGQGRGARIPVVQGWFNIMLGPVDTSGRSLADAFATPNRFVEVTVSNRPPIAPRQQILTTPFAFQAANSAKLAGYDWSAVFGTNNPVAGTIPFSKLGQRQMGTNVGVGGVAISLDSGLWQNGTTNYQAVSNLIVTLQTTGRPVQVQLVAAGPSLSLVQAWQSGPSFPADARFRIMRNGSAVWSTRLARDGVGGFIVVPPGIISHVDFPSGGEYTYTLEAAGAAEGSVAYLGRCYLIAFEL